MQCDDVPLLQALVGYDLALDDDAMVSKRAQGRPARGADEVGRDRIVQGMREALRVRRHGEITRNEIAGCAGVTPALVSYYFPDRHDLIIAATQPVVEDYAIQIKAIMRADRPASERLQDLINLLLTCHLRDANLLDAFNHHMSIRGHGMHPDLNVVMVQGSADIVRDWLATAPLCLYDADFLNDAIWALCEFLARKKACTTSPRQERSAASYAGLIYALLAGKTEPRERMARCEGRADHSPSDGMTSYEMIPSMMIGPQASLFPLHRKRATPLPMPRARIVRD